MDDEYFSGGLGHCYYSPDYYYTFTTTILSSCIFCEIIAGQTLQQLPEIIENCYQQNQLYHQNNHRISCHHGNQKIMTQFKSSADQITPTFNA
jgi:hypothetical protein